MTQVDVQTEIVIHAPRGRVAAYAADPDNFPRWYANIDTVEWKTGKPMQVGSRLGFTARFLSRRLVYTYEVKEWLHGEKLVMATTDGPFPMETTYQWSDEPGGGTRMVLRNSGTPSGFSGVVGPAMAAAMKRANQKDLARIKGILEAGAAGDNGR